MKYPSRSFRLIFVLSICAAPLFAQNPAMQQQREPEFILQGQQLVRAGKLDDALALYRKTLEGSPKSVPANIAAGNVLDLLGRGQEARRYFSKAIDSAGSAEQKAMAERSMAMSYAFAADCKGTVEYEQRVFDYYAGVKNFYQQGEIADEAARVCIDAGDLAAAEHWYRVGHDIGLQEPNISAARRDLWDFRWEHALARLAARRGNHAEAEKHVAAAKQILAKGTNPGQEQFFPYLEGYVAFYAGDYHAALDDFAKANQNDPFIQCLLAQTYEKLGDKDKALDFYRKAASSIAHNPPAAYAVPFAKKRLALLSR